MLFLSVFSPRPIYSSGYEFDGIGAFEVLRGGDSIAVSDGWSSIYWNPANLSDRAGKRRREIGIEIRAGGMFNLKSDWGLGFGAYCPLMQDSST